MKKIKVEDAVGMTLCHDITAMRDGFKGAEFKRGHVIEEGDIEKLLNIGKKHIFVWEENAGELHEEDCAIRLSAATICEGVKASGPSEGKILFSSEVDGMFKVDTDLLHEIDSIDDVTITCLPDHYPVTKGKRIASMRIVPLVTKEANIIKAEKLCSERQLFTIYPYHHIKAGVIITGSEVYSGRIKDKFEPVIRKKLAPYPCDIIGVTICDDDLDMITTEAKKLLDARADVIFFSGGMSVDPDDLTPSAIRALGADVISHGVPSQPGNMTLISYLGDIPLLGIPGAAISMPTTVLDVILPQIFACVKFTKKDLINLADGGVCQLCGADNCHFPNCTFGRY